MFEHLEEHLKQVYPKYSFLFRNATLPVIKPSKTSSIVKKYFDKIIDSQLWFLGKVMYNLDYAILPYDFKDFLESVGRIGILNQNAFKTM